jgi:hypothetical protein
MQGAQGNQGAQGSQGSTGATGPIVLSANGVTFGGSESVTELLSPSATTVSKVMVTVPDSELPSSGTGWEFLVYLDDASGANATQLGFCQILGGSPGVGQTTRPHGGAELDSCSATFGAVSLSSGDTISIDTVPTGTPPTATGSIAATP